jgi:prepilin-type N-terminal cleavage/methylation domain-containing protein
MNQRRGYSLTEMQVVIAVGSVLMTLSTGVLVRSMRVNSTLMEQANLERTATRLSQQFRQDVHRAEGCVVDDQQEEGLVMRLAMPDEQPIEYHLAGKRIERTQAVGAGQTRRELFLFTEGCSVALSELEAPQRVGLLVERETGLVGEPPRVVLHVEAVVGQLVTLSKAGEEQP